MKTMYILGVVLGVPVFLLRSVTWPVGGCRVGCAIRNRAPNHPIIKGVQATLIYIDSCPG